MEEQVVLVNEKDEELGLMEKMEAHRKGLLHRAFSVFVFNAKGETLLHKRAAEKYHSGGLWTNACCSHPRKGESYIDGAHRRLVEEMGFDCPLTEVLNFIYKAELDSGLTEHEFDRVFVGRYENDPVPNPGEVEDWKWVNIEQIEDDMQENPENYTAWFRIIFEHFVKTLRERGWKLP